MLIIGSLMKGISVLHSSTFEIFSIIFVRSERSSIVHTLFIKNRRRLEITFSSSISAWPSHLRLYYSLPVPMSYIESHKATIAKSTCLVSNWTTPLLRSERDERQLACLGSLQATGKKVVLNLFAVA
mmetsp:Transcript_21424/g.45037  ORF Transcript_21424/g.45037 Transcript_21424/m.45037 type:complete len:127 (-) Transcript_21424:1848-2228(-)